KQIRLIKSGTFTEEVFLLLALRRLTALSEEIFFRFFFLFRKQIFRRRIAHGTCRFRRNPKGIGQLVSAITGISNIKRIGNLSRRNTKKIVLVLGLGGLLRLRCLLWLCGRNFRL